MTRSHPIMGYPSKSAAAWALKQDGYKHAEIAEQIGVKECSVGNLIRVGRVSANDEGGTIYTDRLNARQRERLRVEAKRRGLSTRRLVACLLAAVADDGLFAAVLDTGGEQ